MKLRKWFLKRKLKKRMELYNERRFRGGHDLLFIKNGKIYDSIPSDKTGKPTLWHLYDKPPFHILKEEVDGVRKL